MTKMSSSEDVPVKAVRFARVLRSARATSPAASRDVRQSVGACKAIVLEYCPGCPPNADSETGAAWSGSVVSDVQIVLEVCSNHLGLLKSHCGSHVFTSIVGVAMRRSVPSGCSCSPHSHHLHVCAACCYATYSAEWHSSGEHELW